MAEQPHRQQQTEGEEHHHSRKNQGGAEVGFQGGVDGQRDRARAPLEGAGKKDGGGRGPR